MEETEKSLWNKNSTEITVGDSVKIQLVALGVIAGIYGGIFGGLMLREKLQERRRNRKNNELTVVK